MNQSFYVSSRGFGYAHRLRAVTRSALAFFEGAELDFRFLFYRAVGASLLAFTSLLAMALLTWSADDPSLTHAIDADAQNVLGFAGAAFADLVIQIFGLASVMLLVGPLVIGTRLVYGQAPDVGANLLICGALLTSACLFGGLLTAAPRWPLPGSYGGIVGDLLVAVCALAFDFESQATLRLIPGTMSLVLMVGLLTLSFRGLLGKKQRKGVVHGAAPGDSLDAEFDLSAHEPFGQSQHGAEPYARASLRERFVLVSGALMHCGTWITFRIRSLGRLESQDGAVAAPDGTHRKPPRFGFAGLNPEDITQGTPPKGKGLRGLLDLYLPDGEEPMREATNHENEKRDAASSVEDVDADVSELSVSEAKSGASPGLMRLKNRLKQNNRRASKMTRPPLDLLQVAAPNEGTRQSEAALKSNASRLEKVLGDFGVKGEIVTVKPGPVVTLYELAPAPGIKSSRVIGLADDIARSMSALSARVAVVPGRNAIGIELPNEVREPVLLREILEGLTYEKSRAHLPLCLGKMIGGEPVVADLAKMPHLLVAGTTGSGKSVAINTMILSLLYKMTPQQCRLIMVDPKMLELSVYDGIPHLLAPVVTDPKKAVLALRWAVREMEERYQKMSKLGVRNIDGYNRRVASAKGQAGRVVRTVQTGFCDTTGEALFEKIEMQIEALPYIVVVVDEMADLMMVAGKEIEGAVQRLAQMARAAGIHLVMATQRPSVDVITGTIKANFPTRISFQVTSRIDSRTILGDQGAEQLLGQGDMLYMAGGGKTVRLHGPFVADEEVEAIVTHLKAQGAPSYLDDITRDQEPEDETEPYAPEKGDGQGADVYDQAVAIVLRDKKPTTSYIQRRLSIGYNRAASLIERMEQDGIVSAPSHTGRRQILVDQDAHQDA